LQNELSQANKISDTFKREERINRILKKYKNPCLTSKESARVLTFYKIARIRIKISYHAWLKGCSVKQLLLN